MSFTKYCVIAKYYGRIVKFGPSGRSLFTVGSAKLPIRYRVTKVASNNLIRRPPAVESKSLVICFFDAGFRTSSVAADLNIVPNKPSTQKLPFPPNIEALQNNNGFKSDPSSSTGKTVEPVSSRLPESSSQNAIEPRKPKKSLWVKFKNELIHYYHGFRLLGVESAIAAGMCFRLLAGKSLTRRERNQLVRTVADIFRLVPFAVFIIVPFMEFLLPLYLKFFPFMLPSTFKEKNKEDEKVRQRLKAKLEMARFLQDTVSKTTGTANKKKDLPTIIEFQDFLKTVRQSGQLANTTDILRFSRLFEDQVTLDSLSHQQLKALCQLLEINSIGPSNLLRFHLWLRVRQLRAEDKLIAKEGVNQIPSWELQTLSRSRGMRSIGLTEDRLRSQLSQWLELHLEKNIPISLLLLSRAMYLQDTTLPPEQQLQHVISVLPQSAAEEAAVKAVESTEDVDPKTKLELLRKEQKTIKAERAAARKAAVEKREDEELVRKAAQQLLESDKRETLIDKAETLVAKSSEELKDTAKVMEAKPSLEVSESLVSPLRPATAEDTKGFVVAEPASTLKAEEPTVSSKDLDSIKVAIENIADSKKAMLDEGLQDLADDIEETMKIRQQVKIESEKVAMATSEDSVVPPPREVSVKPSTPLTPAAPDHLVVEERPELPTTLADLKDKDAVLEAGEEQITTAAAAKKAAKTEKAVKRLGAQVDRLLGEIDGLMEMLRGQKKDILDEIHAHEDEVKVISEDEAKQNIFACIRADQQRVVDINDIILSLQSLQKAPEIEIEGAKRWQQILNALDEDNDGKIELKHLVAVVKMLETETVELNTSQLSDMVEMIEQEELLEEKEEEEESDLKTNGIHVNAASTSEISPSTSKSKAIGNAD